MLLLLGRLLQVATNGVELAAARSMSAARAEHRLRLHGAAPGAPGASRRRARSIREALEARAEFVDLLLQRLRAAPPVRAPAIDLLVELRPVRVSRLGQLGALAVEVGLVLGPPGDFGGPAFAPAGARRRAAPRAS